MNAHFEKELEQKDMKADFSDMMIDNAEKEYKIDIRENSFPGQPDNTEKKHRWRKQTLQVARDNQTKILPYHITHQFFQSQYRKGR